MDIQNLEALVARPTKIIWDESFSVGVDKLDEHHQVMARLINRLADFILQPDKSEMMAEIVAALGDYAVYHFVYEEGLMAEHGFSGLVVQRKEHQDFCRFIARSRDMVRVGIVDPVELFEYLNGWWRSHILEHDMEYKPFFATVGVS